MLVVLSAVCKGQTVELRESGGTISAIVIEQRQFPVTRPVVTFSINERTVSSLTLSGVGIKITKQPGAYLTTFTNTGKDTLRLHNVVPLGNLPGDTYITGIGSHRLSRTHLFQPGRAPVNVIVPDNAWDLGYCSFPINDTLSIYALARRVPNSTKGGTTKRFETILAPGGSVAYEMHVEAFRGEWQEGLRKCFQQRHLYDLSVFDDSLYKREDLKWIRKAYVMHLMMAWDKDFYDSKTGSFNLSQFLSKGKKIYGGDDVVCIWPTWPTLGLDQRNQFDMYRDLPGGLPAMRKLADTLRSLGARFFIAYNPWDGSTRNEGHLQGLATLIRETTADGVVLDTKGESSRELQLAADQVRPGVVMYSEGMAVPKDMPGIVSGRVHNALYYPPMLNLNKLIRTDFAIFRVAEVYKEPIRREYATSFFNGYGTEINQFPPGHPEWEDEQYKFLGRTTKILRESSETFTSSNLKVLMPTLRDSIWVNEWRSPNKTLYTIFSVRPTGHHGPLFKISESTDHYVDLWHHQEIVLVNSFVPLTIDGFPASDLGTNNEGQVSCVAGLKSMLKAEIDGNILHVAGIGTNQAKLWLGDPSYDKTAIAIHGDGDLALDKTIGRYEGKVVVQLFSNEELVDERILYIRPGTAKLISSSRKTPSSDTAPKEMVRIPAGQFTFKATHGDDFIPYPDQFVNGTFNMTAMWMDRYPVTNSDFKLFLDASGYKPRDTTNFLKHWKHGKIPVGQERFPVVYVSQEDAQHYAAWAGKRLPTELEWQYAAQTDKLNEWPWKQNTPVRRKEEKITETLTVFSLDGIDKKNCNLGDGKPYPVGKYKSGVNPFGLMDLVGCVWQLTNDVYESGSYRYILMKGGSYFKPSSSWWYVQGGPRELHYRQYLLRVSEGFERNATVGFRCVRD